MNEPVKLFKALADKSRLKILNRLMDSPMYVEVLAERLELTPSTVSFHLKKLLDAGLVEKKKDQYYVLFSLKEDLMNSSLKSLIDFGDNSTNEDDLREAAYRQKVLDNFFEFGKLKTIPVQRKKRLIILQKICESFEPYREYSEREVNIIIADFHDDFATLRREMICEKLFTRENSIYQLNT